MVDIKQHIKQYAKIGIALSAEKNINTLLEMIVDEARAFCRADAGTLYILDKQKQILNFEIIQNDTMDIRLGGTRGETFTIKPVPLFYNDKPNYDNVSSYVALTGKAVNIPDVYHAREFDFTGPKTYDSKSGYRSKSMLVIPMKNHEDNIIGVLQLLNAQNAVGAVIPFSSDYEDMIESLASQAAVALNNVQLIRELERLFQAFIKSIATAIDEKSPYTGGHIRRVAELTSLIAETINTTKAGPFGDIRFNHEEMEELRIAAWMHDVGKITTPEFIADKMTRLETIYDRIDLIETRFRLIIEVTEKKYLHRKISLYETNTATPSEFDEIDKECSEAVRKIENDLTFIRSCNKSDACIDNSMIQRLSDISKNTFSHHGKDYPYLTEDELNNLCIPQGTLTQSERKRIENHVAMTLKITSELPFPEKLSNVPRYAGAHHEKLDGSGYPRGLTSDDLPIQSRIIGLADIFEALTAKDRPYKGPMKLSQALSVLQKMSNENFIDPELLALFIESGIHEIYAHKELNPEQIDIS